jgi:hypothetical protein
MRWLYGSLLIFVGLFLIFAAVRTPEQKPNPAAGDTVPTQAYSPDKHCDEPGFGHNAYYLDDGNGPPIFLFCF